MKKFIINTFFSLFIFVSYCYAAEEMHETLHPDWSFEGPLGKFERASLQRGYQVYTEVCAGCHSMDLLSYRNLIEEGGPEFSKEQAKAMAAMFETEGIIFLLCYSCCL